MSRFTWIMNRPCFRNRQSYVTQFLILERKYRFDASGSEVAHGSALVQSDVQFVLLRLTQPTIRPRKLNYHQTFIDARFRCACLKSDAPWRETNSSFDNRREGVGAWESARPCVWSHWRFRDVRWRDVKPLIHGPPMEAIFRKELPPDNRRRAELCYGKRVLALWSQVLYGTATGW